MWDTIGITLYLLVMVCLLPIILVLYIFGGVLDLTYFERHRKDLLWKDLL